jgi:hypothetical protein
MGSTKSERESLQRLRVNLVEKMREPSELAAAGVHYRIRPGPQFGDNRVDIGIPCGLNSVVLTIPRMLDPRTQGHAETRREVLEALLEQIQKQLAIEALEGR